MSKLRLLHPSIVANMLLYTAVSNTAGSLSARQVGVPGEILNELPYGNVVASPQRYFVHVYPQQGAGEIGHQQLALRIRYWRVRPERPEPVQADALHFSASVGDDCVGASSQW